ncbi:Fe-S cluster assembly protein SufD [Seinonella peptonophila]|uniref:Fe-S cluster assembly protein SufD n=1 Tax=Seinonella peptonophila TaxID=112248 RepID=A0A1M4ZEG7_9BACL|nr:Fe-S cluster assembly protein SufD [Seinonella peptonophila]SHF16443.1 Fe-S cluster assembly protein SufD [Seinonella peptonophila]
MSVEVYQENIREFSSKRQEPEWLRQKRLASLALVAELDLPKLEKTNVKSWGFTDFVPVPSEQSVQTLQQLPASIRDSIAAGDVGTGLYVQKNQESIFEQVDPELQKQGVIFTSLEQAIQEHGELVEKYLLQAFQNNEHQVAALHGALLSGAFLYVPRNVEVKVPQQAIFALAGNRTAAFPHLLVVAETGSKVEVIANYFDYEGRPTVLNSVIEVYVKPSAHVQVTTVNHTSSSVVDTIYRRAIVERDGHLEWVIGDFSSGRLLSDQTTYLRGEGAHVGVKSLALGAGSLRSNITSSISHFARHTTSDIQARSVVKDEATNILNSITKIEKGASQSDGQQSGKVLMLDSEARGDANPILLIDENDVTAGHAASVGRVDPLQLYYLMSRGISRAEAEKLIVFGFLDAVIREIPSESLQNHLRQIVERKFDQ